MDLHAHVYTVARDCDGAHHSERVIFMTDDEQNDPYGDGDLVFKERLAGGLVNFWGEGTLSVTPEGMKWDEQTEEGYVHKNIRWCSCG